MGTDKNSTFTCAKCGGVFTKAKSDEDARKEFNELWPGASDTEVATICDDCFNEIMDWLDGLTENQKEEITNADKKKIN